MAPGGKLRLFRSPEPNGEAAPAIFGVFPFAHHPHLPVILQNPAIQASAATHSLTQEERRTTSFLDVTLSKITVAPSRSGVILSGAVVQAERRISGQGTSRGNPLPCWKSAEVSDYQIYWMVKAAGLATCDASEICSTRSQQRWAQCVVQVQQLQERSHMPTQSESFARASRPSPTRLDGGRGLSRTRFASANSPVRSLRTPYGAGISQVPDFTTGAL